MGQNKIYVLLSYYGRTTVVLRYEVSHSVFTNSSIPTHKQLLVQQLLTSNAINKFRQLIICIALFPGQSQILSCSRGVQFNHEPQSSELTHQKYSSLIHSLFPSLSCPQEPSFSTAFHPQDHILMIPHPLVRAGEGELQTTESQ